MSYFTTLWTNETWDRKAKLAAGAYPQLDYAASKGFSSVGVKTGSTVFIVTVKKGILFVGGLIKVHAVLNKTEAAIFLKRPEEDLWPAQEYIVAAPGSELNFEVHRSLTVEDAANLKFSKNGGFVSPKTLSSGMLDRQTLRNVRKLYPGSEALLSLVNMV